MKYNKTLYKKLLRRYKNWQGDEAGIEKFKEAIEYHQGQKYFQRTLRKFQKFINGENGAHLFRHTYFSPIHGITKVTPTTNFKKLNILVESYYPLVNSSLLNDIAKPIWNFVCKMMREVNNNPWLVLIMAMIVMSYFIRVAKAQSIDSSEATQEDAICPANTMAMPTDSLFQQGNNPVLLLESTRNDLPVNNKWDKFKIDEVKPKPISLRERVLSYIEVEEGYAKTLTAEKID